MIARFEILATSLSFVRKRWSQAEPCKALVQRALESTQCGALLDHRRASPRGGGVEACRSAIDVANTASSDQPPWIAIVFRLTIWAIFGTPHWRDHNRLMCMQRDRIPSADPQRRTTDGLACCLDGDSVRPLSLSFLRLSPPSLLRSGLVCLEVEGELVRLLITVGETQSQTRQSAINTA